MVVSAAVPVLLMVSAIVLSWYGDGAARPCLYAAAGAAVAMVIRKHVQRETPGAARVSVLHWLVSVVVPVALAAGAGVYVSFSEVSEEKGQLEGLLDDKVAVEATDPLSLPVAEEADPDREGGDEAEGVLKAARTALDAGLPEAALQIIATPPDAGAGGQRAETLERALALFVEAQQAFHGERPEEAAARLHEAIEIRAKLGKPSASVYQLLGRVEMLRSRWDEAEEAWLEAIRIDPDHGAAYTNLARLMYLKGDFKKAEFYNANGLAIPFVKKTAELVRKARDLDRRCRSGDFKACHELGLDYFYNVGRTQNPARRYLTMGCEGGVSGSCRFLRKLDSAD